jgi:hypothetical protein
MTLWREPSGANLRLCFDLAGVAGHGFGEPESIGAAGAQSRATAKVGGEFELSQANPPMS